MEFATGEVRERETGRVVVPRVGIADTLWERTVGLMGVPGLEPDGGLWLEPCNGIHTAGMRFALDVVLLDRNGKAIRLTANVRPWRVVGPIRDGNAVMELPVGTIRRAGIVIGRHYSLHRGTRSLDGQSNHENRRPRHMSGRR
jgi:uncharacterized membrane protein (UPF0127 family)